VWGLWHWVLMSSRIVGLQVCNEKRPKLAKWTAISCCGGQWREAKPPSHTNTVAEMIKEGNLVKLLFDII
jgi:hypothetical protein